MINFTNPETRDVAMLTTFFIHDSNCINPKLSCIFVSPSNKILDIFVMYHPVREEGSNNYILDGACTRPGTLALPLTPLPWPHTPHTM